MATPPGPKSNKLPTAAPPAPTAPGHNGAQGSGMASAAAAATGTDPSPSLQHHHANSARTPSASQGGSAVPPLAAAAAAGRGDAAAAAASPAALGAEGAKPPTGLALDRFRGGVEHFQQLINELSVSVERQREELCEREERLNCDRRAFEEECTRVHHELEKSSEQVVLNVGGHKFTTTCGTLRNAPSPSLFSAMFSGRHTLKTDESGCYFLDRDGRHFHDILNFLRDRVLSYPTEGTDFKYLLELRAEAEYYGLVGLVQQIDRFPYGLIRVQRAATLNLDDSWMYEDGQDEVVFTVASACQLLGVGLCGTEGGLTVELEVYEVEAADFSAEVCTLQTAAQSFTKGDGQIVRMLLPAPALLQPGKYYMLSALIKGSESYCCEDGMDTVIAGGIKVTFQSWESPNGTNEQRGQFPEIYVRAV